MSNTSTHSIFALRFNNVSKYYNIGKEKLGVLNGFTLTVSPGEVVGIVGRSGCGKSTILRLAAGLEQPCSGTIERTGPGESIAFVFQQATLLPWLTTFENISLVWRAKGKPTDSNRIFCALKKVGLAQFANAFPRELSGGMRARAEIARAMCIDSSTMLLDEPLGDLDELTRNEIVAELRSVFNDGDRGVLYVTHDLQEAAILCDRILAFQKSCLTEYQEFKNHAFKNESVPALRKKIEFVDFVEDMRSFILDDA